MAQLKPFSTPGTQRSSAFGKHAPLTLCVLTAAIALADDSPIAGERVIADLERRNFAPWTVERKSFGTGPLQLGDSNARQIRGYGGRGLAVSRDDAAIEASGSLFTADFQVTERFPNFRIGGGNHPLRAAISLWHDGRVVRTTAGKGTAALEWMS